MPTPNVPAAVSHFRIERPAPRQPLLFEATDTRDGSAAAVQLLEQAGSDFETRALAAAGLRSPYTARLLGYGADGQIGWLAYEAVAGPTAAELARCGALTPGAAFRAAAKAARALQEAQVREVAHGGISPEAIAIDGTTVKLLGFGVLPAPRGIPGDIADLGAATVELLAGRPTPGATTVTAVAGLEAMPAPLAAALDQALAGGSGDAAVVARQLEAAARAVEPVLTGVDVALTRRGSKQGDGWAVRVTNSDDIPATVTLAAAPGCDPELAIGLPGLVTVAAGETLLIPVEVKPAKRRWRGARKARAFAVVAALPALDLLFAQATAGGATTGVVAATGGAAVATTAAGTAGGSTASIAGAGSMAATPAGSGSMGGAPPAGSAWAGPSPVTTAPASFVDKPVGMVALGALGGATVAVTAAVVVPVAVLAGGGGDPAPAAPETPVATVAVTQAPPTQAATPTATVAVPTATPSPAETATATPTATPSATPSAGPSPTGTPTTATPSPTGSAEAPVVPGTATPAPATPANAPAATASPTAAATATPPPATPTVSQVFLADQQYLAAICPVQQAYVPAVMKLVNDLSGGADPQTVMSQIAPAIQAYAAGIAAATPPPDIAAFHVQWVALAQAAADAIAGGSGDAFDAIADTQVPELPASVIARWQEVIPTVPACSGTGIG